MYSPTMESSLMSPPIGIQSLYLTFSVLSVRPWTSIFTSPLDIIQRGMAKLSRLIKLWNNTSMCIVTTSRTTGLTSYPLQSSPTTMLQAQLQVSPPCFTNKGYHPNLSIHPEYQLTSEQAQDLAINLFELHEYLHTEMKAA